MTDKPLHVRVAEALGCIVRELAPVPGWCEINERDEQWVCRCPGSPHAANCCTAVVRYDKDWAATGPLIHRFKLRILPMEPDDGGVRKEGGDWRWQVTPFYSGFELSKVDGFGRYGDGYRIDYLGHFADRDEHGAIIFLDAATELIGVCHLIIAMGKAGWLEDPPGSRIP